MIRFMGEQFGTKKCNNNVIVIVIVQRLVYLIIIVIVQRLIFGFSVMLDNKKKLPAAV